MGECAAVDFALDFVVNADYDIAIVLVPDDSVGLDAVVENVGGKIADSSAVEFVFVALDGSVHGGDDHIVVAVVVVPFD